MKPKILDIKKFDYKLVGSGAFGAYYKLTSKRGVKIFLYSRSRSVDKVITKYNEATLEALALKQASDSGLTPKLHQVVIAKLGCYYYWGILMEHFNNYIEMYQIIDNHMDFNYNKIKVVGYKFDPKLKMNNMKSVADIFKFLSDKLYAKSKCIHHDLHPSNILVKIQDKLITDVKIVDLATLEW